MLTETIPPRSVRWVMEMQSYDLAVTFDLDGIIREVKPLKEEWRYSGRTPTGYEFGELLDTPIQKYLAENSIIKILKVFAKTATKGTSSEQQIKTIAKDGEIALFQVHAEPLHRDEEPAGVITRVKYLGKVPKSEEDQGEPSENKTLGIKEEPWDVAGLKKKANGGLIMVNKEEKTETTKRFQMTLPSNLFSILDREAKRTGLKNAQQLLRHIAFEYAKDSGGRTGGPRLEHLNTYEDHAILRDNQLNRVIFIYFKNNTPFCDFCEATDCLHVRYIKDETGIQKKVRDERG